MKKSYSWSLGFLIVAVSLTLLIPAGNAATRHVKPPPPKKTEKHTTVYWEVGSADASANTIELQKSDASSNLTLKVTSATKITVEGKPGKLSDLQKGQKVNFTASGENCSSIEAVAASEPKKKKK